MSRSLELLDVTKPHAFITPVKKINEGQDVSSFLTSQAYRDIGIFITQLNISMCARKVDGGKSISWQLDSPMTYSHPIQQLQELLQKISSIIDEAPPDTGPRRFGNISFRVWYELLEGRIEELLKTYLPQKVLNFPTKSEESSVLQELTPYILGGFGSAQRLDYGTGHELSFLAFLGCLVKLGAFSDVDSKDGSLERELVIGVIEPYLIVVRRLILTYTLEPAGSHGVWGLDDHSFISYILGSAQYSPAINAEEAMPTEGALFGSPKPSEVVKKNIVDRERNHNMYFSAVGFIYDVKTGPFWEHSPILFDISGVPQGWGKINKGMIKMYNAEVLSKFPVVQHFPFGSMFSWDQDTEASAPPSSVHTSNQPSHTDTNPRADARDSTKAPLATPVAGNSAFTSAPWAGNQNNQPQASTRAPWAQSSQQHIKTEPMTQAPWASQARGVSQQTNLPSRLPDGPTRAPWAPSNRDGQTQQSSSSRTPDPATRAPWAPKPEKD